MRGCSYIAVILGLTGAMLCSPAYAETGAFDLKVLMNDLDGPIRLLLALICYGSGFIIVIRGLMRLVRHSDPQGPQISGIGTAMHLILGAGMVVIPTQMGIFSTTMFGTESYSYASLDIETESPGVKAAQNMVSGALHVIQIAGVMWFIGGWFDLLNASDNNKFGKTVSGAITRLVAATCCMNIFSLLGLVQNTFGLNLVTLS